MELQFPSLFLFLAFCILLVMVLNKGSKSLPPLPPGPWKLPIIGDMHHLVGTPAHRALRDLARRHGPLMLLRLGQVDVVAVSSREVAEEILKTRDLNFASRPELLIGKVIFYDRADLAFSSYSDSYRQLRKVCVMELFSATRVRSFTSLREEETLSVMRDISMTPGTQINLRKKLMSLSNNIIARAAFGRKCEQQQRFIAAMKDALETATGFTVADSFPSLKFLDVLSGFRSRLEAIHREVDGILDEIISQHQDEKDGPAQGREEDLVDMLLRVKDRGDLELPLTIHNVKAVILDIFFGGTKTSAVTIEWAMSALMKHPEVMKKAQAEVRGAFKGRGKVEDRDVGKLTYLKLVIKETLRLYPTGPILLPRECKEACQVLGYKIPAGSRVLVNNWALARDPRYWDEPETFKPERFEDGAIDFKGASYEFVPFGAGRRMCPGMAFGMANVELALAQLLFCFDWELPHGMKPEDLDMTETAGATAVRRSELSLVATRRIPLPS